MTRRRWRTLLSSAPISVAVISVAFSVLISVPVLLFVYQQTDSLFEQRIRGRIDDRQANMLYGYRTGGLPGLIESIQEEVDTGIIRGGAILLVDSSGRKLVGNIAAWPPTLAIPTDWTEMRLYPEGSRQAVLFALRTTRLPTGERLLVATNVEDRERMRASLVEALFGALLLAIPLGLIGGVTVLRITERRARAVGRVAARIAAGDFSQRIDEQGEGQTFGMLAAAINAMLERIERLVNQLQLVTDALAHDLRTPLMRIRVSIERAAARSSDEPAHEAFEQVSREVDGMLRLISTTLEISRTEAGVGRANFVTFDVAQLLRDLCEFYHPLAEELGVSITLKDAPTVNYRGNRELLGQAVSNLIDNALKYARGSIELALEAGGPALRITVADRGPGIPADRRLDALRKYGRLEEARTTEGSGLGLALVRAVVGMHGGDLLLEDNDPGLRAVIVLPTGRDATSGEPLHIADL